MLHHDLDMDMVTGVWYTHVPKLGLYPDFEGAENIHVLKVLIWGFVGCSRFLAEVWHLDMGWYMVTNLLDP